MERWCVLRGWCRSKVRTPLGVPEAFCRSGIHDHLLSGIIIVVAVILITGVVGIIVVVAIVNIIVGVVIVVIVRTFGTFQVRSVLAIFPGCGAAIFLIQELFDLFPTFGIDLDQVEGIGCAQFDHA